MKPETSKKITKKFVKQTPKWLDLPRDIWIFIFIKLGTVDVLRTAQNVCSLWNKISKEPQLFRCVDIPHYRYLFSGRFCSTKYVKITKEELNRCSIGELVKLSLEYYGTDELLELAIAKSRSRSSLRCLRLANCCNSKETFIKIAAENPMLEVLDLPFCHFDSEEIGIVGQSCQLLKSFRLTRFCHEVEQLRFQGDDYDLNEDAYAIANNMPGLRRLHLHENKMDNKGMKVILDKCPHLEYLDLRRCFGIDLKGDLLMNKSVEKIRNLRLPNDSIYCYEFLVGRWW